MKDAATQLYDRLLILRCQAGDEAALAELIARYSPGLRFFLRKMTRQDALADDLLQDTWFDVYRKISRLQRPDAFVAWLYRIARDKAYCILRRRPESQWPSNENLAEAIPAQEENYTLEEAVNVRAAVDTLPDEPRDILVLRFIEEMSYEQIGVVISRPVGTVRSRIHYAKLALREKLETPHLKKGAPS